MSDQRPVTELLVAWGDGSDDALEDLTPLVYKDLQRIAAKIFAQEYAGHTLQPTAVVHEAYIRLVDQRRVSWQNRAQFFAICGRLMRRILVDHARRKQAGKRQAVTLINPQPGLEMEAFYDALAVEEALSKLEVLDPRQVQIIEMRFFAGLTIEETSHALSISLSTVKTEWRMARAWLLNELKSNSSSGSDSDSA